MAHHPFLDERAAHGDRIRPHMIAHVAAIPIRRPGIPILLVALGAGALGGVVVAWNPLVGLALLFALVYAPIAMTNLPLALGLWLPLIFLEGLPGGKMLPEAGAIVIAIAWVAQAAQRESWQRRQLQCHGPVILLACAFVLWLAISLIWAEQPGRGITILISATEVLVLLVLVATTPSEPSHIRAVAMGFVAGAVLSSLIGIVGQSAGAAAVDSEGRLQGAAGDPNFFAAQMVAGMTLALGLLASARSPSARLLSGAALLPLTYGVIASESRGGFVALIATGVVAIVVFRRHRVQILAVVAGIAAVMGIWLSSNPAAWDRITNASEDRGSGREDLWTIALRTFDDHPILGVGVNNFAVQAPRYTREPGTLTGVIHIETELGVHNAYLSLLTETGVLGVTLFLGLSGSAVLTGVRGGQRFERSGDRSSALLTRAGAVALTGMLSAAFFLSDAEDKRIWVLMGFALASAGVSRRIAAERQQLTALERGGPRSIPAPFRPEPASHRSSPQTMRDAAPRPSS